MPPIAWVILWVILGIAGRAILPALIALLENPSMPLDKKFLLSPVLFFFIGLVLLPFFGNKIDPALSWYAAWAIGWAVTDMLRDVQKVISTLSKPPQT